MARYDFPIAALQTTVESKPSPAPSDSNDAGLPFDNHLQAASGPLPPGQVAKPNADRDPQETPGEESTSDAPASSVAGSPQAVDENVGHESDRDFAEPNAVTSSTNEAGPPETGTKAHIVSKFTNRKLRGKILDLPPGKVEAQDKDIQLDALPDSQPVKSAHQTNLESIKDQTTVILNANSDGTARGRREIRATALVQDESEQKDASTKETRGVPTSDKPSTAGNQRGSVVSTQITTTSDRRDARETAEGTVNSPPPTESHRQNTTGGNFQAIRRGHQGEPIVGSVRTKQQRGLETALKNPPAETLSIDGNVHPASLANPESETIEDQTQNSGDATRSETDLSPHGRGEQLTDPANSPAYKRLIGHAPLRAKIVPGSSEGVHEVDRVRLLQRVSRAIQEIGGEGQLRVRLSPPELGSLRLEVTVRQGIMSARIEAETPAARSILLDGLPALRERLAGQDIRVDRFDVDLMNQSPRDSSKQQSNPFAQPGDEHRGPQAQTNAGSRTSKQSPDPGPLANAIGTIGSDRLNIVI
jgi:flagellar hook-length control protein FliK